MELAELMTQCPGMSVTVSAKDLLAVCRQVAQTVLEEANAAVKEREATIGDRLIPAEEAQGILGKPHKSTMWRWKNKGYLTPVKIGVRNFYPASEIRGLIERHKVKQSNTQEL